MCPQEFHEAFRCLPARNLVHSRHASVKSMADAQHTAAIHRHLLQECSIGTCRGMKTLPVLAYGFSAMFRIKDLEPVFAGTRLRISKSQLVAEYEPDRIAVVFPFGALVFINVVGEERVRVVNAVLNGEASEEPHPPLEEDFLIEVAESTPAHGLVRFDRVVVPELSAPVVDLISLLLAQSVTIDYYDEDLQQIMQSLETCTNGLACNGRIPGSTHNLLRFVGSSIGSKNQIITALALLDKPAATWESEHLDHFFRDLRLMLEIEERFQALEHKLRAIQETLELLLELVQTRRMLWLEATIVILILVEIIMSLLEKAHVLVG